MSTYPFGLCTVCIDILAIRNHMGVYMSFYTDNGILNERVKLLRERTSTIRDPVQWYRAGDVYTTDHPHFLRWSYNPSQGFLYSANGRTRHIDHEEIEYALSDLRTFFRERYTHPDSDSNCDHFGNEVSVGNYSLLAGGTRYFSRSDDLADFDLLVPLTSGLPKLELGYFTHVLACPWTDYAPPPHGFRDFLEKQFIPNLKGGKRFLVYCIGSHGRTGTFIASLIALLEPYVEDPIAEVRSRHCAHAVETYDQVQYVFSLRGEETPQKYDDEFTIKYIKQNFLNALAVGLLNHWQYIKANFDE